MKSGWEKKKLGEVCELQNGFAFKSKLFRPSGVPVLRISSIQDEQICDNRPVFADPTDYSEDLSKYKVVDGDLLIAMSGGTTGKVGFNRTGKTFLLNQRVGKFVPTSNLDIFYLFYFLSTKVEENLAISAGSAQPNLSTQQIKEFSIPLPPLPEQQRIVAILDQAFDAIATAKANAEKNLKNAREIFESYLNAVFTQRGEGWVEKRFEELIESNVIGLTKSSREQGEDKAWPYVKMNNITRDNRFDFSSFTCVDATSEEVRKFSLKDGDFLFNTRNSYELVGKSCIYESDLNDAVLYNNNIMRVRFQRGVDARFVLLSFSAKGVADELNALKSGTTNVSAIYFKDLKSLVIPAPPIAEQKKIATKLKSLVAETQRLESIYQQKLVALDELKKSLLHQAFTGEL